MASAINRRKKMAGPCGSAIFVWAFDERVQASLWRGLLPWHG
ncbi:hypothetical protein MRBBS_2776 [Marinobacter sp. BSs20148]|nr:hypothetical protein MRBBS_2776 [Marinobacter sp. BSs20148]